MSRRLPVAVLAILALSAACATARRPPDLQREIDQILLRSRGRSVAVAFYDLRDGTSLLRGQDQVYHAASMMKVPVMLTVFEAVDQGALRLDEPVRVHNTFKSIFDGSDYHLDPKDDSDDQMYTRVGRDVPLELLVRRMIVRSSNLATNNVIELVGPARVMALMERIGARNIRVLRGVEDSKAFQAGMNNTVTAYDLMLIFRALGEQKIVSAQASKSMIDILAGQEFNSGIPVGLPRGTRVAHKTGDIAGVAHDGGLVFRSDGSSYVLVVLTRGFRSRQAADRIIARISRAVWRARGQSLPRPASSSTMPPPIRTALTAG